MTTYVSPGFPEAVARDALAELPRKEQRPEMTERQRAWCREKWPWFGDNRRFVRAENGRGG